MNRQIVERYGARKKQNLAAAAIAAFFTQSTKENGARKQSTKTLTIEHNVVLTWGRDACAVRGGRHADVGVAYDEIR